MFTRTQVFVSVSILIYVQCRVQHRIRCRTQCRQFTKMSSLIDIPPSVRGLKKLDKSLFAKLVDVPCLVVGNHVVPVCFKYVKKYLLKLVNFRNVQPVEVLSLNESKFIESGNIQPVETSLNENECIDSASIQSSDESKCNDSVSQKKRILLDPTKVNSYSDFTESVRIELEKAGVNVQNFTKVPVNLTYENWEADEILKAVLPLSLIHI